MARYPLWLLLLWVVSSVPLTTAHSLSPALVELVEESGGQYRVRLKQTLKQAARQPVMPELPSHCKALSDWQEQRDAVSRVLERKVNCGAQGLAGQSIVFPSLAKSGASLVLKTRWHNGASFVAVAKAGQPKLVIAAEPSRAQVFTDYFAFGMSHLLTGLDHLLFLTALVLLVQRVRPLVAVVTAFTLGHAMSVVIVTLGIVNVPSHWVEVFIALSILLLSIDAYFRESGDERAIAYTALLCAAFGVLHGMGFASALDIAELARWDKAVALLAFNLGIEAVQLFIVAVVTFVLWLLFTRVGVAQRYVLPPLVCVIGTTGALWFWERLLGFFLQF